MYIIIKDGPDVHTTKKFGGISISSCFFRFDVCTIMDGLEGNGC
jgi:hypothetical protein